MVVLIVACSMLSGINLAAFKIVGLLRNHQSYILPTTCIAIGVIGAVSQFVLLNKAISYYRQVDVCPVYQSMLIVFNIACGLMLFDESRSYTSGNLLMIFAGSALCIAGVSLICMKDE